MKCREWSVNFFTSSNESMSFAGCLQQHRDICLCLWRADPYELLVGEWSGYQSIGRLSVINCWRGLIAYPEVTEQPEIPLDPAAWCG
jgi:hypothetical protein